ncbi:MAG: thioesterase [Mycobacterium sp.]|nr:thioesterase [Mycobacterium sp.]
MSPVTTPGSRLYIFPHAGGTADFYTPFARALSPRVRCVAVQYPGKRAGRDLSKYTGINELADTLATMLKPGETPGSEVAFFGHSMGALLAFELAARFEAAGNPVAALFVSACAAPGLLRRISNLDGTDLQLLSAVSELTGVNPEFLKDDQFAATLLPTLRGLKAIAAYEPAPDAVLSCPIYALRPENDALATAELVSPWRERTTGYFEVTVFDGGHFYITENLLKLSELVEKRLLESHAG